MKYFLIFCLGILFLSSFCFAKSDKLIGISEDEFGKDLEVVVKMRSSDLSIRSFSDSSEEVSYKLVKINSSELQELQEDPNVVGIYSKYYIRAFLTEATSIVNSTISNDLVVDSLNLSGGGQTVCVIDTGVNFSHPDLVGKNESCVIDCYNKTCIENCSISDDNGHGTHVSGIVAASGEITGIAPNVSLIGVKILGSDGGGSGNNSDLPNAVDYCVSSGADVISMSFGTSTLFSSSCDSVGGLSSWKTAIDDAVSAGVAVVAASGNDGSYTGISAPACLSNAIPVGDTYDANVGGLSWGSPIVCTDSTTALDKIVCHANRNSLVKLFAPGALINSTSYTGGYVEEGGTSMSTPIVSAAIAILKEYLNLSGQSKIPSEIEDILNDTGLTLDDTSNSGNYYSRIDIYEALLSIDATSPEVSLISPVDNHINSTENQTFVCNVSDWQLDNLTFMLWNSSGLFYNETVDVNGTFNESSFNYTSLPRDEYSWNCYSWDLKNNLGAASSNFSLIISGISVSLDSPENDSYTNVNDTNFTCTSQVSAELELVNVTFSLWNSSSLIYNESRDISGIENITVFNWTFLEDGNYSWGCVAYNNISEEGDGVNYTLTFDTVSPNISSLSSGNPSTSSATISWVTDEVANSSIFVSGGSWSNSSSYVKSHSISVSGLSSSTSYSYVVYSCDRAGNCVNDSGSFTTDAPSSSGGGGGGSSSSSETYDVNTLELIQGYSQELEEDDEIEFIMPNRESHSLVINDITSSYVKFTVSSDPVTLSLGEGESVKLNLTSKDYYDLFIRVDSINRNSAEFTIQTISERIFNETTVIEDDSELNESSQQIDDNVEDGLGEPNISNNFFSRKLIVSSVLGLIIVGVIIYFVLNSKKIKGKKRSNNKKSKTSEKKGRYAIKRNKYIR